jgi:hypothetical protein
MAAAFLSRVHANGMVCASQVFDAMSTVEVFFGSRGAACSAGPESSRYIGRASHKVGLKASGESIDGIGEGWNSEESKGSGGEDVEKHAGQER